MATDKQKAANKINAQKSTGPKTESGKAACSGNALKHGITGKKFLRPDEDPAEVERICQDLRAVHQPEDAFMEDLIVKIAMTYHRMSRALRAEAEHSSLAGMLLGDHDDRIKNLVAYSAMIRKDLKSLEQSMAEHKERRAALRSAASVSGSGRGRGGGEVPVPDKKSRDPQPPPKSNLASEENRKTDPISTASCNDMADTPTSAERAGEPVVAPSPPPTPPEPPRPVPGVHPVTHITPASRRII